MTPEQLAAHQTQLTRMIELRFLADKLNNQYSSTPDQPNLRFMHRPLPFIYGFSCCLCDRCVLNRAKLEMPVVDTDPSG